MGINMNRIKKETKTEEKKCWECGGSSEEKIGYTPEGLSYNYWKCKKCGDEILTMRQLHDIAKKERKVIEATISKWGTAIAMRIPKSIVQTYNLVPGKKATIIPEKTGFKVISRKTK
jgi:hypothetical protein